MLPTKSNKGCTQGSLHRSGPYSLVLPTKSNQGCTQGSKRYTGPACCKYSHVCGRIIFLRDSPKAQGSTITTTGCCGHTRVCCRTNQRRVAPKVKVYDVWPTKFCWEHAHVCGRTNEPRVAPKRRRLQRFGRPVDQLLLWAQTCVCQTCQVKVAPKGL